MAYSLSYYMAHSSGGALVVLEAVVYNQVWFPDPTADFTVGQSDVLRYTVCP